MKKFNVLGGIVNLAGDVVPAKNGLGLGKPLGLAKGLAYDYKNQAWLLDGQYERCSHPEAMDCQCYGKVHEGETPCADNAMIH
jgi:hypothetical protein